MLNTSFMLLTETLRSDNFEMLKVYFMQAFVLYFCLNEAEVLPFCEVLMCNILLSFILPHPLSLVTLSLKSLTHLVWGGPIRNKPHLPLDAGSI